MVVVALSMLFTPALERERALKAWRFGPHAVILDLEDTVPPARKDEARASARSTLSESDRPYFVRINPLSGNLWRADVEAVVHERLAGLLIPKVDGPEGLAELDHILSTYETSVSRQPPIPLLPTIESVRGLDEVRRIAAASGRISSLTFGEGDFTLDLGLDWNSSSPTLVAAKARVVMESRLAGLAPPHDGVFPRLEDTAGLEASCQLAKSLGFGCKHAIHPRQLEVIHRNLAPSETALSHARAVVREFEAAIARGSASIVVDGHFVDYPVYYRALQTLKAGEPR